MFLLVLAFSFLAAQIVVKNREVFADEDGLMECEVYECGEEIDVAEEIDDYKEVQICCHLMSSVVIGCHTHSHYI